MMLGSTGAGQADPQLFAEVTEMLGEVTGESAEWVAGITPNTRLEDGLRMESIELIALGESLRDRYGVDAVAAAADLDVDAVVSLTVGDLVAWVARHRKGGGG